MNHSSKKKVVLKRKNYSKGIHAEYMQMVIEEAKNESSPNIALIAERKYVSRKSLDERLKGGVSLTASPGKKPLLDEAEEETLVKFLIGDVWFRLWL